MKFRIFKIKAVTEDGDVWEASFDNPEVRVVHDYINSEISVSITDDDGHSHDWKD